MRPATTGRWKKLNAVELTEQEIKIVKAMVQCNMKVKPAAKAIPASHMYIRYNIEKLKRRTGLDPHNFFDLMELYRIVEEQENEIDS